jgi:hypothetical protein
MLYIKNFFQPGSPCQLLLKLPVLRRVKAVKYLFLSRIDSLQFELSHFAENDSLMLEGLIDLTESINSLVTEIEILHQHIQELFRKRLPLYLRKLLLFGRRQKVIVKKMAIFIRREIILKNRKSFLVRIRSYRLYKKKCFI